MHRLQEGIERFLITDINNPGGSAVAQSEVAVMWDWIGGNVTQDHLEWFNHVPGGCNVLYMDGHVKFNKSPDPEFPVNKLSQAAMMST